MQTFTVHYLLNGNASSHTFELNQAELPAHDAALHLIVLHFGDGENSLVMPPADATAAEVLAQAEVLGLTQIEVG